MTSSNSSPEGRETLKFVLHHLPGTPVASWPVNVSSALLANIPCTGFFSFSFPVALSLPNLVPSGSLPVNHIKERPRLLVCFLGDQPIMLGDWEKQARGKCYRVCIHLILSHKNVLVKNLDT